MALNDLLLLYSSDRPSLFLLLIFSTELEQDDKELLHQQLISLKRRASATKNELRL